jgi:hypothetical protein
VAFEALPLCPAFGDVSLDRNPRPAFALPHGRRLAANARDARRQKPAA